MSEQIVYLNGNFIPVSQATVSVMDRGFLFGDGVYEVIPSYGGNLLRPEQHLQRLQNSLDGIRLENPHSVTEWSVLLQQLVTQNQARNSSPDQSVYLQVTRGVMPKRDHRFPQQIMPTVFAMSNPLLPVNRDQAAKGIRAVTLDDIRWRACNIKATALLANTLLRQQASDVGSDEAILIRDGMITEGSASNVMLVKNGVIITPPTGPLLLPGITRDLVLELARTHDIGVEEREIPEAELKQADELWITSSTREIMPVVALNNEAIADGKAGPLWWRMIDLFQAYKQQLRQGAV